jgi:hypothetical protein
VTFRPIVLTAALLLAACNRGDQGAAGERKAAAGDVLGGSISDAMLPLDTVTSQSPPLRDEAASPEGAPSAGKAAKPKAKASEGVTEPEPSPSATPEAEN